MSHYDPLSSSDYDVWCSSQDSAEMARRESENALDEAAGAILVPCSCSHGCYECKGTLRVPRRALRWDDGGASEAVEARQERLPW